MGERLKDILKEGHVVKVDKVCMIPQDNGEDILLESCTIDGDMNIIIVSDTRRAVAICRDCQ